MYCVICVFWFHFISLCMWNKSAISIATDLMFCECEPNILKLIVIWLVWNTLLRRLFLSTFLPKSKWLMFSPRLKLFLIFDTSCSNSQSLIHREFKGDIEIYVQLYISLVNFLWPTIVRLMVVYKYRKFLLLSMRKTSHLLQN